MHTLKILTKLMIFRSGGGDEIRTHEPFDRLAV